MTFVHHAILVTQEKMTFVHRQKIIVHGQILFTHHARIDLQEENTCLQA